MNTPRVIGLHGYARSGKDTVAEFLKPHGYQRLAFADRLRECMYALDPIVGCDTHGRLWRLQEVVDEVGWDEAKGVTLSEEGPEIRRLLQVFGTEVGRQLIKDSLWVDIVLKQIQGRDIVGHRFVITDVRFPNELEALRKVPGAQLWKINRAGVNPVNSHISDAGIPDDEFDLVIENDGTLQDLKYRALAGL